MNTSIVRKASAADKEQVLLHYKKVSQNIGGLARNNDEITETYIQKICSESQANGIQLAVESNGHIIAEIHCYK